MLKSKNNVMKSPPGAISSSCLKQFFRDVIDLYDQILGHSAGLEETQGLINALQVSSGKTRLTKDKRMELFQYCGEIVGCIMDEISHADLYRIREFFSGMIGNTLMLVEEFITNGTKKKKKADQEEYEIFLAVVLSLVHNLPKILSYWDAADFNPLKPHLKKFSELFPKLMLDHENSDDVREAAAYILTSVSTIPTLVPAMIEEKYFEHLVNLAFELCSNPKDDDLLNYKDLTSYDLSSCFLDGLFKGLAEHKQAAEFLFPFIYQRVQEEFKSEDYLRRKSAMFCLAALPERAGDFLKAENRIQTCFELISKAMEDKNTLVCCIAFLCASEFIEHIDPEFRPYHKFIITRATAMLEDGSLPLAQQRYVIFALQEFCTNANKFQAEDFLHLLPKLLSYAKRVRDNKPIAELGDLEIDFLGHLVSGLENLTVLSSEQLMPFVDELLSLLLDCTQAPPMMADDGFLSLSSEAIFALKSLIDVVGAAEPIKQQFSVIKAILKRNQQLPSIQIRGNSHSLFQSLVSILPDSDESFAFFLEYSRTLLRCLDPKYYKVVTSAAEEQELKQPAQKEKASSQGDESSNEEEEEEEEPEQDDEEVDDEEEEEDEDDEEEDEDDEEEDEDDENIDQVRYNATLALAAAAKRFGPRLANRVQDLLKCYGQLVRSDAGQIENAVTFFESLKYVFPTEKSAQGEKGPLSPAVESALETALEIVFSVAEEANLGEVLEACEKLLDCFGSSMLSLQGGQYEKLLLALIDRGFQRIRTRKAAHNMNANVYTLCDQLFSLLVAIARVKGPAFLPLLKQFYIPALELCSPTYTTVGFLAEMFDYVGPIMNDKIPELLEKTFLCLEHNFNNKEQQEKLEFDDNDARFTTYQNAVYALGAILFKGGATTKAQIPKAFELLQLVQTRLAQEDEKQLESEDLNVLYRVRENVTSAIGKLLMVGADVLPLKEAVELFLSGLPLQSDLEEIPKTVSCLMKMINTFDACFVDVPRFTKILEAYASMSFDDVDWEQEKKTRLKAFIEQGLKALQSKKSS